jgi:hypothetical protein
MLGFRLGRCLATAGALIAALASERAEATPLALQNDGFVDMAVVGFQQGFKTGEMGASTLGPVSDPFTVSNITLLFGPQGTFPPTTVTLHIYEDDGQGNVGAEIFTGDVQLMPADNALQQIDLSGMNVTAQAGSIRVAIEFKQDGAPSIARDTDGTIVPGRNWIFTGGNWKAAEDLGLPGDWILRAEVDTMPSTSSSTGGGTSSGSASTGASMTGATGSGSSGTASGGGPCTPGAIRECTGDAGCSGVETCDGDGKTFGPCDCDNGVSGSGCGCVVPKNDGETPWLSALAASGFAALAIATVKRSRPKR